MFVCTQYSHIRTFLHTYVLYIVHTYSHSLLPSPFLPFYNILTSGFQKQERLSLWYSNPPNTLGFILKLVVN